VAVTAVDEWNAHVAAATIENLKAVGSDEDDEVWKRRAKERLAVAEKGLYHAHLELGTREAEPEVEGLHRDVQGGEGGGFGGGARAGGQCRGEGAGGGGEGCCCGEAAVPRWGELE
jgi:hypothetical protein